MAGGTSLIYCLMPVFNDWTSCRVVLQEIQRLNEKFKGRYIFRTVIVNDCSTIEPDEEFKLYTKDVHVINLKINVGHQRAIAAGLQFIYNEFKDFDKVVVMDSDGEDKPEDIPLLIERCECAGKIIFAQRKRRQETLLFKTGYFIYKHLFRLLTGHQISFGNFSVIPHNLLKRVVLQENIWNHYSGAIIQSKIPFDKISLDRGKRYEGVSKMNLSSLVLHGLSSIAVYFDFLSIRILTFSIYGISICSLAVLYILFQKLFTNTAIPGWASSLILIIMGIILQLFLITLIVLLMQLSSRKNIAAPNTKRYIDFLEEEQFNSER